MVHVGSCRGTNYFFAFLARSQKEKKVNVGKL
jgi:hypothetical protein